MSADAPGMHLDSAARIVDVASIAIVPHRPAEGGGPMKIVKQINYWTLGGFDAAKPVPQALAEAARQSGLKF